MSPLDALAKPHITGPFSFPTELAILLTALKSPGLAKGNPASITSTPNLANWWAMASYSSTYKLAPGECSPSRRVVSNIKILPGSFDIRWNKLNLY